MAKDFFEELGEAITKTAREIGGRAEVLYGTQKLKNKISGEERQIQKIMEELGKVLYRRYREGVPLDDLQRRLCEQIDQRMTRIEQYKRRDGRSQIKEGVSVLRNSRRSGRSILPSLRSSLHNKGKGRGGRQRH